MGKDLKMGNNQNDSKILIVDDSPLMIDVLRNILPKTIKRQIALNGIFALKLLKNSVDLPDLILLDILMPGLDGYEVCKEIKADSRLKEIPVIFISGLDETFDKVKAFQVGAIDFITKPFQKEEVIARINTHLEVSNSKKVVAKLYSETIQGIMGAMSDMLALANPQVARVSNSMKTYSEKVMQELGIKDTWDLKSACVLSGLGMLSGDMKGSQNSCVENPKISDINSEIDQAYHSLNLSNEIIQKIPKFDAITKIIEKSMAPLDQKYWEIPAKDLEPAVLKGQILRILIYYIYRFQKEKNHIGIIEEMKNSEEEFYTREILEVLAKIQKDLIESEVLNLTMDELLPKMILVEDLYCPDGRMMLKSGFELSNEMIMLIKNLGVLNNVTVKVIKNF